MPDLEELFKKLMELPPRQYGDLLKKVDLKRREATAREVERPMEKRMSRDQFAEWIARQHFAVDKGISRILYLPNGASPEEVRLLEVNELASIPENAPVEASDFMPDIDGLNYSLYVADVTPRQLDEILAGRLALPLGWQLDGNQQFTPDR